MALIGTGALLLIVGAVGTAQAYAARGHLLRGSRQAAAAATVLRDPLRLRVASQRTSVRRSLAGARGEFAQARRDLTLWSPVLSHLGWIPSIGPQLMAAGPAADVSYRTADAAVLLVDGLDPVLRIIENTHAAGSRLPRLSAALAAAQPKLRLARSDMDAAAADLQRLPVTMGNPNLDRMLRRLRTGIPRLRTTSTWLALAPDLLGADHPAKYLFVWQNPAEIRATGGFLGASDLLTISRGHISHQFYGHQLPRDITWPAMPLPEEIYTPESTWLFEDSNWSPDFRLSARFERWFYGEDTGSWADGVVNFLDTATPDLLRATGPVYLPEYHLWVDAGNVTSLAQRYVNGHNYGTDSTAHDIARKHFFFGVLKALMTRVEHISLDRLPAIGAALDRMIRRRELLLYDRRPAVATALQGTGADGRVAPGSGDYLFVVDDNRSYNKLNPYVHEDATYAATITRTLGIESTLTIHYHVGPSPADLEGGGPNWGLWGTKHDYQDFIRVYVPPGATLESMSGIDRWPARSAYGATQFAGRILVRQGQSATVVIRYRIPANVFTAGGRGRYHLLIQHQPGANLQNLHVTVRGAAPGVELQRGNHVYSTMLPLGTDARVSLDIGGRLDPRPIALPPPPAVPDPYIPFALLRDPRHPL